MNAAAISQIICLQWWIKGLENITWNCKRRVVNSNGTCNFFLAPLCIEKGFLHLGRIALRKIINRFLSDFNQAFLLCLFIALVANVLKKLRQASLLLGLATVLSMHFLVGRVSFFQLFGKEGLLVFCRQLILDQLIRDELARKLLFVMYQVEYR